MQVGTHTHTIDEMLKVMARQGWRITEQRRSLATLFAESESYLSPKDVYEYMKQQYPGVSFDTVYRNLRLLSEMGVLEQFHLADGLKFKASCQAYHHHHMICVTCEKTVTFEFCPMKHLKDIPESFDIQSHRFEIFGYCSDCKSPSGDSQVAH
ncbi:transcriptional repressor [Paenibacillus sp. SYP-B3998]|uniref:Transcriptional repressor n=1 Tax=Paenibacillus sp. SYP-B3998 TaxID=2678564 RepID=A0A6G3ZTM6_9BACL|nr:Fur family transcriptional regulator [Paenibacillus sp. SYP-B3998]NEW05492.1 transcriptional repressor [Paenibacillus sp. SYP-B3998]